MNPLDILGIVIIGLAAGTISGLFGIGGGALLVPAMVLLLGFQQHLAQGTSLMVIIPTTALGAYTHYRNGFTRARAAAALAVGGIVGALIGSHGALAIDTQTLRTIFVLYLIFTGLRMSLPAGMSFSGVARRLAGRSDVRG